MPDADRVKRVEGTEKLSEEGDDAFGRNGGTDAACRLWEHGEEEVSSTGSIVGSVVWGMSSY
jgi:hypothetical protein